LEIKNKEWRDFAKQYMSMNIGKDFTVDTYKHKGKYTLVVDFDKLDIKNRAHRDKFLKGLVSSLESLKYISHQAGTTILERFDNEIQTRWSTTEEGDPQLEILDKDMMTPEQWEKLTSNNQ